MENLNVNTNVRYARLTDMPSIKYFDRDISEDELQVKVSHKQILIAELGGKIVGYLRLDPIWTKVPYIGLIWVIPELRGNRIGKTLLYYLEEKLKQKGEKFLLSSSQTNEFQPQEWHRKMGFFDCGTLENLNGPGVGEVFFRKDL